MFITTEALVFETPEEKKEALQAMDTLMDQVGTPTKRN
jgi:hypothetical protein